ncbi:dual OB domain-containing protein [Streptomyces kronopolitis]
MALIKTLVCLANSRKLSGRCMAGMVGDYPGEWVRPVSARQNGEVAAREMQCEDGTEPNVLDIVSVPLLRPQSHDFQSENWLLDPGYRWKKTDKVGWRELLSLEQYPNTLWINGPSSYHGANDRIPIEEAITLPDSLKLIRVTGMALHVHAFRAPSGDQKRVLRARFSYNGHEHILRVTDPKYELQYLGKPEGLYELDESFLTVSLGEPFDGHVYKLVAAIIERAKIQTGSRR